MNVDKYCEDIVTNLCKSTSSDFDNNNSSSSSDSITTTSESTSECLPNHICDCGSEPPPKFIPPPNIQHELNTAKSILIENSSVTGENVFDHLADLIKKITDQRPPNVVDYFEEFSRNLREQKFHNPYGYLEPAKEEPRTLTEAENIIMSLKLKACDKKDNEEGEYDDNNDDDTNCNVEAFHQLARPIKKSENVLQIKLFWSLCGCGFQFDEIYQLSFAMMKLIQCPIVEVCRFWGKIYGLNNKYYIVEVDFVQSEKERRYDQMRMEMEEIILNYQNDILQTRYVSISGNNGEELIPGLSWIEYQGYSEMKPDAAPIPQPKFEDSFDTPPEPVGSGLNRRSYFVITCLTDEWIELPIVTPKQIVVARQIKKYFTGDLEAAICSYPIFPGVEKHYLRATIARITASTYIAPIGFYRKRTKKDDIIPGEGEEAEEEEEEEEAEEEEGGLLTKEKIMKLLKERDAEIIANQKYTQLPIEDLASSSQWVHIRPSILDQGRIMYFDEEKVLRQQNGEQEEEEEEEEDEDEGEDGIHKTGIPDEAIGAALFSVCEDDTTADVVSVWTSRLTSKFNKMNRMAIMRSNIWPGSYSFTYQNFCDTIYIGWGEKYVPRNYLPPHIPEIQFEYEVGPELKEVKDPTAQMEEEWRLAHLAPIVDHEADEDCYEEEEDEF